MKKIYALFLITFFISVRSQTSTSFWYEGFNSGPCSKGVSANNCIATATNGAWSITTFSLPFMNGPEANEWFISAEEQGQAVNVCGGVTCGGFNNKTLHMSWNELFTMPQVIDLGTDYQSGTSKNTNKRAETPIINCSTNKHVQLSFGLVLEGVPNLDYCDLEYSLNGGTTWSVLTTLAAPNNSQCPTIGTWTFYAIGLPSGVANNANVKVGYHWYNSDPTGGNLSIGIDDIQLSESTIATSPTVGCLTATSTASISNIAIGNTSFTWAAVPNTVTFSAINGTNTTMQFPSNGTYTILVYGSPAVGAAATSTAETAVNVIFGSTSSVTALSNTSILCNGNSAVLTASGSTSYTWSTSSNSSSIIVSPTVNTTYTVTGKTGYCVSTTTIQQLTSACTELKEIGAIGISNVFPNPFSDELFIATRRETEIKLINIHGEVVKEMKVISDLGMNTSDLPKGIYFLNLRTNEGTRILKLVKE